jgi:8-oxo-dGTP diphosphatase
MTKDMQDEASFLGAYDPNQYVRPVGVPADIAIFTITTTLSEKGVAKSLPKKELKVMLIKRGGHPEKGKWALPGGFSSPNETLLEAAKRELKEETGVEDIPIQQFGIYDKPGRDKRGWIISVAHVALVHERYLEKRKAADDAESVQLFTMDEAFALDLAFDHRTILEDALKFIQKQMLQTTIAKAFLNDTFTISELMQVIKAVVPTYEYSVSNFIRRLTYTKLNIIEETGGYSTAFSQRPAKLYRFTGNEPTLSLYE